MNDYFEAYKLIDNAKTVALICHVNPDGDTLGSALALRGCLIGIGKEVDVLCDDEKFDKLDFLLEVNPILRESEKVYDLAVSVDCGDLERMGLSRRNFIRAKSRLVIDHHKTNDKKGDFNVIEPSAAATAQIMFKFLSGMKDVKIGVDEAKLLYASILTDSGGFYYESTSAETHEVAASLIKIIGSAHNYIYYKLFEEVPQNKFALHHSVLATAKFYEDGAIAMIKFTQADFDRTGTDISYTEGAVSELQKVKGVKISIAVTEVAKNSFKISFRSRGDTDVSQCTSFFGGGGHKNAAGCRLCGYYEDVKDKLLKVARDAL